LPHHRWRSMQARASCPSFPSFASVQDFRASPLANASSSAEVPGHRSAAVRVSRRSQIAVISFCSTSRPHLMIRRIASTAILCRIPILPIFPMRP
jgi:hypothetical protein